MTTNNYYDLFLEYRICKASDKPKNPKVSSRVEHELGPHFYFGGGRYTKDGWTTFYHQPNEVMEKMNQATKTVPFDLSKKKEA